MLIYLLMILNIVNGMLNVGTVLFKEIDVTRTCWTKEEISLLNSRRILQDLIPEEILHADTEVFIPAVLEYFESCVEAVEATSKGKAQYFMLSALADSFGGWLHVYALPHAKEQFYAGSVQYEQVHSLYQLYDELKLFLKTNGTGWKEPTWVYSDNVQPLTVEPAKTIADPCSALIVYEKPKSPDGKEPNNTSQDSVVIIPMPILDDKQNPNAIAMPFPKNGLRSLTVASSAYIVEKYYVAGIKCLMSSGSSTDDFSQQLYAWIVTEVVPHLHDYKWYPAFGGVLRILKAMRNEGIDKIVPNEQAFQPNDESLLPYHSRHRPLGHLVAIDDPENTASNVGESSSKSSLETRIILGLIIVFLILTILCFCYWCFTRLRKRSDTNTSYRKLDSEKSGSREKSRTPPVQRSTRSTKYSFESDTSDVSRSTSDLDYVPKLSIHKVEATPWLTEAVNLNERPSTINLQGSGRRSSILTSDSTMSEEGESSSEDLNTIDITTFKQKLSV